MLGTPMQKHHHSSQNGIGGRNRCENIWARCLVQRNRYESISAVVGHTQMIHFTGQHACCPLSWTDSPSDVGQGAMCSLYLRIPQVPCCPHRARGLWVLVWGGVEVQGSTGARESLVPMFPYVHLHWPMTLPEVWNSAGPGKETQGASLLRPELSPPLTLRCRST